MIELSNREIAGAILLLAAGGLVWIAGPKVRSSVASVIRSAAQPGLIALAAGLVLYGALEVYLLHELGYWNSDLLKVTLVWFVVAGVPNGFRGLTSYKRPPYWQVVRDGLRVIVVVEFVLSLFTFGIGAEILLLTVGTLLAILLGAADQKPKHGSAKKALEAIQVLFGSVLLVAVARRLWSEYGVLADPAVWAEFFLPPVLSLLFIPAVFLMFLFAKLEWLFGKVRGSPSFRRRARLRLFLFLGPRPEAILRFGRAVAFTLPHVRDLEGLEELITTYSGERQPTPVLESDPA